MQEIPEYRELQVEGILSRKGIRSSGYDWYLRRAVITYQDEGKTVTVHAGCILLRSEEDTCPSGARIRAAVSMSTLEEASNEGSFDAVRYYHSLGISAVLYAESGETRRISGSERALRERVFHLRTALRSVYEETLNETDAGILAAMVLGDKSLMEQDAKDLYTSAGISHILAVSGLHISVIGMGLYRILRKRRAGYLLSAVTAGSGVFFFCMLSGMSVSAVRAGIMFAVYLGAEVTGRKYDSLRALLLAAAASLMKNPFLIQNAGFLFSYSAVLGAACVGGLARPVSVKKRKGDACSVIQKKAGDAWNAGISGLWMSASILLVTLPLTAWFYYEVPVFSLLTNLIVLPFAGVLLTFGIVGGAACLTGLPFAWIFFLPCHLILRLFETVCGFVTSAAGGTWITGKPGIGWMILYYLLLGAAVFFIRAEKSGFLRRRAVSYGLQQFFLHFRGISGQKKKRGIRGGCLFLPAFFLILMLCLPSSGRFEMTFLDVGQGDGIYINGGNGNHYFVDGGSSSESEVGRYRILPFLKYNRVRGIDCWFVSHADSDHISGLLEVLQSGYRVEKIVISQEMPQDDTYRELKLAAEENGTELIEVSTGDTLTDGELSITFYAPVSEDMDSDSGEEDSGESADPGEESAEEIEGEAQDRNEKSLVQLVEYQGVRFLLTGDIGEEQEEWLIRQPGIGQVTILKAAHHGSKYSNSTALLSAVRPSATVISCSEDNSYGHPSAEALSRMEAVGSTILETMESGQIRMMFRRGKLIAEVYKDE